MDNKLLPWQRTVENKSKEFFVYETASFVGTIRAISVISQV